MFDPVEEECGLGGIAGEPPSAFVRRTPDGLSRTRLLSGAIALTRRPLES